VGLLIGLELFSRKGHREKAKIGSDPMEANMPYTPVVPKGSAPPLAPYSPGTKVGTAAGSTVYVSGTPAIDKESRTVGLCEAKPPPKPPAEAKAPVLQIEKSDKPADCVIKPVMTDDELRACGARIAK